MHTSQTVHDTLTLILQTLWYNIHATIIAWRTTYSTLNLSPTHVGQYMWSHTFFSFLLLFLPYHFQRSSKTWQCTQARCTVCKKMFLLMADKEINSYFCCTARTKHPISLEKSATHHKRMTKSNFLHPTHAYIYMRFANACLIMQHHRSAHSSLIPWTSGSSPWHITQLTGGTAQNLSTSCMCTNLTQLKLLCMAYTLMPHEKLTKYHDCFIMQPNHAHTCTIA